MNDCLDWCKMAHENRLRLGDDVHTAWCVVYVAERGVGRQDLYAAHMWLQAFQFIQGAVEKCSVSSDDKIDLRKRAMLAHIALFRRIGLLIIHSPPTKRPFAKVPLGSNCSLRRCIKRKLEPGSPQTSIRRLRSTGQCSTTRLPRAS